MRFQTANERRVESLKRKCPDIELLSDYTRSDETIRVRYKDHNICQHEWVTTPTMLKRGKRCPTCKHSIRPDAIALPTHFRPQNFSITNYLNETKLGIHLKEIFQRDFIHNKVVPDSNLKTRPDYRNDELMLIVEFDGYKHYTDPCVIYRDKQKDSRYSEMGYKVVRIPYFIQLETRTIKTMFGVDYLLEQYFPHGFIVDDGLVCPASYCRAGAELYKQDAMRFSDIWREVEYSLQVKLTKYPREVIINEWV